jgi:predicted lysophospholipase L1 biosynthesis ABC-type transport system permease subunit
VVAGLNDRRRPFALLRLAGTPLRLLRRVVLLESAVPLLVSAAAALGTGFLAAFLFLRAQLDERLQAPGPAYWGVVAAGLVLSLAIIASTLPALARITGPENARND